MNITLKQNDIEKAVRLYIERQGFHLHNKTLGIDFSMGRGDNGLSASVTIEDSVVIPGFTDAVDKDSGPSEAVKAMAAGTHVTHAPASPVAAVTAAAEPIAAVVDEVVEEAKTAPATLKEAAEALLVPSDSPAAAAVLQQTAPVATAEAKVADASTSATPAAAMAAPAEAKPTTSLFG